MKKVLICCSMLLLSVNVFAGSFTGKISQLIVDKSPSYNNGIGVVHIRTSSTHHNKPGGVIPVFLLSR